MVREDVIGPSPAMNNDRFQLISELFEAARHLPSGARASFLDERCGDDAALRAEVIDLLVHHESEGHAIDQALLDDSMMEAVIVDDDDPPADCIPGYTLIRRLGVGGMGVVYLAQQESPNREVAVKLMRRAVMSTAGIRRFKREMHLLGLLRDPGIAQIYDAGTTDTGRGMRPWFAMEYISGTSLDAYAEREQLDVRGRLELMIQICASIHHAHLRGVVHRDLKPANILVTSETTTAIGTAAITLGQPKILDFGIARAVDQEMDVTTLQTSAGQLIGTLQYMSPEQVEGDHQAVGQESDVYALGVITYELVAGKAPIPLVGLTVPQALRMIAETPPTTIGAVDRELRGDLETILNKALEKEPERRYATARDFGLDLRRYLDHQPISARPPSVVYQFRKFARRNRGLAAALIGLIMVLIVGSVVSTVLAITATTARNDAQEAKTLADERAVAAEWQSHLTSVALAQSAIRQHEPRVARTHLDARPSKARATWEVRHLYHRLDQSIDSYTSGTTGYLAMTVASDARYVIAASGNLVIGRDMGTGEWFKFAELGERVLSLARSTDNRTIAACTRAGECVIIDVPSVSVTQRIMHPRAARGLAFRPGTRELVTAADDGVVRRWNLDDGSLIREYSVHQSVIYTMAVSPDGTRIVTGAQNDAARLVDLDSGEVLGSLLVPRYAATSVSFAPDGESIALGFSDHTVRIASGDDLARRETLEGHAGTVMDVEFDPTGTRLASIAHDQTIRVWDVTSGRTLHVLVGHTGRGYAVAWSGADELLSCASDQTIRRWALVAPDHRYRLATNVAAVDISPDGTRLAAAADEVAVIWDLESGVELARWSLNETGGRAHRIRFLATDDEVLVAMQGGSIAVGDLRTGEFEVVHETGGIPIAAAVSPDRSIYVVGWGDFEVRAFDATTHELLQTLTVHDDYIRSTVFSTDGERLAIADRAGIVTVWDVATWTEIARLEGHEGPLTCVASDPTGHRIAAASTESIWIWDVDAGEVIHKLPIRVTGLLWHPSEPRLFSSGVAGAMRLWDVETGDLIMTMTGAMPRNYLSTDARGDLIATGDVIGGISLWRARAETPVE